MCLLSEVSTADVGGGGGAAAASADMMLLAFVSLSSPEYQIVTNVARKAS